MTRRICPDRVWSAGYVDFVSKDRCPYCYHVEPKKPDRMPQRCPECGTWMKQHPQSRKGKERLRRLQEAQVKEAV